MVVLSLLFAREGIAKPDPSHVLQHQDWKWAKQEVPIRSEAAGIPNSQVLHVVCSVDVKTQTARADMLPELERNM